MKYLLDHLQRTSEGYRFEVEELAPGLFLHVQPTDRFKSVTTKIYQVNPLGPEAAERALIPMVLRCGCEGYPTRKDIAVRLQELYGATMNVNTVKFGHAHMQKYGLSFIASRYLEDEGTTDEALSLLQTMLTRPVQSSAEEEEDQQQGFRPSFVRQERKHLLDIIDSQKEDHRSYARRRCEKHLFMDDPFRYSKYGERDRVEQLEPGPLHEQYTSDLVSSRMDVVVIGPGNEEEVRESVREQLVERLPGREPAEVDTVVEPSISGATREVTEPGDGDQSWLVMAYRTPVVMGHEDMYKLGMVAGLFGGFPHSKLFRQVREEKGLAYTVQASLKRSVGLLLVTAGIDGSRRKETVSAVRDCHRELVEGDLSDQELEMTRRKLIEQLVNMEDNPGQKADSYHHRYLSDHVEEVERIAERIQAVDRGDIRAIAGTLSLEMVYCLE